MFKPWLWMCGTAALGSAASVAAELNVPIAVRVVSFLQPRLTGTIAAAILFKPGDTASEAEANAIERSINFNSAAGRGVIHARQVSFDALGTLARYRVAFVTTGLRAEQGAIAAAAAKSSVLTISSDQACVKNARCVVGISTARKTQITVNRAAARAAKIRFGSAFLMLVKEI